MTTEELKSKVADSERGVEDDVIFSKLARYLDGQLWDVYCENTIKARDVIFNSAEMSCAHPSIKSCASRFLRLGFLDGKGSLICETSVYVDWSLLLFVDITSDAEGVSEIKLQVGWDKKVVFNRHIDDAVIKV